MFPKNAKSIFLIFFCAHIIVFDSRAQKAPTHRRGFFLRKFAPPPPGAIGRERERAFSTPPGGRKCLFWVGSATVWCNTLYDTVLQRSLQHTHTRAPNFFCLIEASVAPAACAVVVPVMYHVEACEIPIKAFATLCRKDSCTGLCGTPGAAEMAIFKRKLAWLAVTGSKFDPPSGGACYRYASHSTRHSPLRW